MWHDKKIKSYRHQITKLGHFKNFVTHQKSAHNQRVAPDPLFGKHLPRTFPGGNIVIAKYC